MAEDLSTKISFPFHMWDIVSNKNRTIEKSSANGGRKRRYLIGVSSGPAIDEHEERMTKNCVKSFMDQANSGEILLYPDIHGIRASEDIGKLAVAKIQEDGDWYTEYGLYDKTDGIGAVKAEKCDDIWKQSCGLDPYTRPRQKGFSVEGHVPPNKILQAEEDGHGGLRKRVIDEVMLDGVLLVPRQAYKAGIASAVYKALGELSPWKEEIIRRDVKGLLAKSLEGYDNTNEYYKKRWDVMDALDSTIEKIMKGEYRAPEKQKQLNAVFDEYRDIMCDLIIKSEAVFQSEPASDQPLELDMGLSKADAFRVILSQMEKISKALGGNTNA